MAINKKDEVEKIQKVVAKECTTIGFEKNNKGGVHAGMVMQSSIMKALEFQIDVDFDQDLKQTSQKVSSIFDNKK